MSSKVRCSAVTKAGKPCRAWAIVGSNPPLCSAHSGRNVGAGAPPGNQNARRHGFYSQRLTPEEIAALVSLAENHSLDDEIAVARIYLKRLLEYLEHEDFQQLSVEDMAALGPLVLKSTTTIAALLKTQRALSGEAADGISGAIAQALAELGNEWGIDLV